MARSEGQQVAVPGNEPAMLASGHVRPGFDGGEFSPGPYRAHYATKHRDVRALATRLTARPYVLAVSGLGHNCSGRERLRLMAAVVMRCLVLGSSKCVCLLTKDSHVVDMS